MRKAAAILCFLMLFGCSNSNEADSLTTIAGLSADSAEGEIKLALEAVKIDGNGDLSPAVVECSGEGLLSALTDGSAKVGHQLYFTHAQVLVIGKSFAAEGLSEFLSQVAGHGSFRPVIRLAICVEDGEEVLKQEPVMEKIKSFELRNIIGYETQAAYSPDTTLYNFMDDINEKGIEGILPMISEKGEIEGTALFKDDKLIGKLDKDLSQVLLLFRGETEKGLAENVEFTSGKAKVLYSDGGVTVTLKVTTESGEEAKIVEERLKEQADKLIEQLKKLDCDAIGAGRSAYRQGTEAWEEFLDIGFQNIPVTVQIKAQQSRGEKIER